MFCYYLHLSGLWRFVSNSDECQVTVVGLASGVTRVFPVLQIAHVVLHNHRKKGWKRVCCLEIQGYLVLPFKLYTRELYCVKTSRRIARFRIKTSFKRTYSEDVFKSFVKLTIHHAIRYSLYPVFFSFRLTYFDEYHSSFLILPSFLFPFGRCYGGAFLF